MNHLIFLRFLDFFGIVRYILVSLRNFTHINTERRILWSFKFRIWYPPSKDGIESANREAAQILAEAKAQAEKIVADARSEADKLRADAQAEIGVFKASAQLSAEQAKRDAVLAFRQEIGAELTKLLAQDTHKALDDKALAALITAALQGEDASAYAAEVASVTDALKSELAGELKAGLELRLSKKVRTGFRLCAKDGSGYIDCSDEELAEQLAPFFRELRI